MKGDYLGVTVIAHVDRKQHQTSEEGGGCADEECYRKAPAEPALLRRGSGFLP
jgi:hypothetical protein